MNLQFQDGKSNVARRAEWTDAEHQLKVVVTIEQDYDYDFWNWSEVGKIHHDRPGLSSSGFCCVKLTQDRQRAMWTRDFDYRDHPRYWELPESLRTPEVFGGTETEMRQAREDTLDYITHYLHEEVESFFLLAKVIDLRTGEEIASDCEGSGPYDFHSHWGDDPNSPMREIEDEARRVAEYAYARAVKKQAEFDQAIRAAGADPTAITRLVAEYHS